MKRHISAVFAAMAVMACSKVAPEDRIPVSENPEGDKQEESVEPKGEGITIQLAQTKVTLGENVYQFEGNEQIYVKARSGESTVMTNTPGAVNTFTGEFNNPLGKESDTFDFYFNCTDGNGKRSFVQNGQPWLVCEGVNANRVNKNGNAYYIVKDVELAEFSDYVALALISPYDCTVDFHSISAKIPYVSEKALPGITLTKTNQSDEYTKPYFVNVTKGMEGGFYLAVQQNGTEDTMYTSYATSGAITKNNQVLVKAFTPFSITGTFSGFETSYSVYNTLGAAEANKMTNDQMKAGGLEIYIDGISASLYTLKNIQVTSDDSVISFETASIPAYEKTEKGKTYSWDVISPETSHPNWGTVTLTAVVTLEIKDAVEPNTATISEVRHITGLPYTAAPPTNSGSYPWKATRGASNTDWNSGEVVLNAAATSSGDLRPLIQSSDFYLPNNESINVAATVGYRLRAKTSSVTTTFAMWISGVEVYKTSTSSTSEKGEDELPISNDKCILTSSKKYIEFESYRSLGTTIKNNYAKLKSVRLEYR